MSIVCGVDHSAHARIVAAFAADLAERLGVRLVLVHAVPLTVPTGTPSWPVRVPHDSTAIRAAAREAGERLLADVVDETGAYAAATRVEDGSAPDCLTHVAEQEAARFLVMGTHAEGAADVLLTGSTSLSATRSAPCPVIVLPDALLEAPLSPPDVETVVCGLADGQDLEPLRVAADLARELGLRLVPAHAVAAADDDVAAERVTDIKRQARADPAILVGEPAHELAHLAEEARAAMVVVGNRGRGPLRASLFGSVSRSLARASTIPVVVCPARAPAGDERR